MDKTVSWLEKGAGYTDTVKAILKYKGILYKKHLLRGLRKGALTPEQVEEKFVQWQEEHKNKVLDHQKKQHKDKAEISAKLIAQEQKKAADRDAKRQAALAAAEAANKPAEEATEVIADNTASATTTPEGEVNTDAATESTDTPTEN